MLEDAGVIQGYEARLAPDEVGLGLTVFVGVRSSATTSATPPAFARRSARCRK